MCRGYLLLYIRNIILVWLRLGGGNNYNKGWDRRKGLPKKPTLLITYASLIHFGNHLIRNSQICKDFCELGWCWVRAPNTTFTFVKQFIGLRNCYPSTTHALTVEILPLLFFATSLPREELSRRISLDFTPIF